VTAAFANLVAAPVTAELIGPASTPGVTTGRGPALDGVPSGGSQSFAAAMRKLGNPQSDGVSDSLLPPDLAVVDTGATAPVTVPELNLVALPGVLLSGESLAALEQMMELPDKGASSDISGGNLLPEASPESGTILPLIPGLPGLPPSVPNADLLQQVMTDPAQTTATNVTPLPMMLSKQLGLDSGTPTSTLSDKQPALTAQTNTVFNSALEAGLSNSGRDQQAFEQLTLQIESAMNDRAAAGLAKLTADSGPVDPAQFTTAQFALSQASSSGSLQLNQLMELPQFQNMRPLQPMADPQAFMKGLGQRLMVMSDAGVQSARLKLYPENLGALDIKIQVEDDSARVWFTAQNGQAREALEAALPKLKEMFAQQGMNLLQADVESDRDRHNSSDTFDRADTAYRGLLDGDSGITAEPVGRANIAYVSERALDIYV